MRQISARTALAFQEDAIAIASWARSNGFPEDAVRMQEFAGKLAPLTAPLRNRWREEKAS